MDAQLKGILIELAADPLYEQMNLGELAYAAHLELERLEGRIMLWQYQPMRLRLGANLYYTPDFLVLRPGAPQNTAGLEMHEYKGFWRDDARAKIKMAASVYPWIVFLAIRKKLKRDGGGFAVEMIRSRPLAP